MNYQFTALLQQVIERLIFEFKHAQEIYFSAQHNNKLIHAGEFGVCRENILKKFLKIFITEQHGIGAGFIIDFNDNCSTQTDIVIYDKKQSINLEDEDNRRFYLNESVVSIGEVKSNLGKEECKKSLENLAKVLTATPYLII